MDNVSIIIVTWNSKDVLPECISSIEKYLAKEDFEIIISDNLSNDTSYLDVYHNTPNIKVIKNSENLGYAKAVNIGFKACNNSYTLILNPDIIFINNPIPKLIHELKKDPEIGAIGPLLCHEDGKPQIMHFYPNFPTILQTLFYKTYLNRFKFFINYSLNHFHAKIDKQGLNFVNQIPGAFLLFEKENYPNEKPLNESFFIWYEDVDFCKSLSDKGKKVALQYDEKVIHLGGTSFNKWTSELKLINYVRSFLTYLHIHHSTITFFAHFSIMLFDLTLSLILVIIRDIVLFRYSTFLRSVKLKIMGIKMAFKTMFRLKYNLK